MHQLTRYATILAQALYYVCFFSGCSSQERGGGRPKAEYLFRRSEESFFAPRPPLPRPEISYPWDKRYRNSQCVISKEFFRCKGHFSHPPALELRETGEQIYHYDCTSHSLPLRDGKEFIYPALIELLNYVQNETGYKVVITSGHRCPLHNSYVDYSTRNWASKHMIGAEVDFYVEGYEQKPLAIIALVQDYYQKMFPFSSNYTNFERYEKGGLNVSTLPWYNKEIFIKLYLADEGRNYDNSHFYPYIGIQLRHDRDLDSKVVFDPIQAQNYLRD